MSSPNSHKFKVIIVGSAGVGKTCLLKRLRAGEFEKKYIATMGVEVNPLYFSTSSGSICFDMWDCSDQRKYQGFIESAYYIGAQAAIIMFDVTSRTSYKEVSDYYTLIQSVCPGIPIVLCGNKVDCIDRKVKPQEITFHRKHNLQYYDISAKSNYNFDKPWVYIARKLMGNDALAFVDNEKVANPQEVIISNDEIKRIEQELTEANKA